MAPERTAFGWLQVVPGRGAVRRNFMPFSVAQLRRSIASISGNASTAATVAASAIGHTSRRRIVRLPAQRITATVAAYQRKKTA